MNAAIIELEIALNTAENNGPIYEKEGRTDEARRCHQNAIEIKKGFRNLRGA